MKLGDLIDDINWKVQDPSIGETRIARMVNLCIKAAAARDIGPLPTLETTYDTTTHTTNPYVELPTDFHRGLKTVYNQTTQKEVTVKKSLDQLKSVHPGLDATDNVDTVAISGTRLYYQGIPETANTLTLHYYKEPPEWSDQDTEGYSYLPDFLVWDLIVNYVCERLFAAIEDGIEGQKVNTLYHRAEYEKALKKLDLWIGPHHSRPVEINDVLSEHLDDS